MILYDILLSTQQAVLRERRDSGQLRVPSGGPRETSVAAFLPPFLRSLSLTSIACLTMMTTRSKRKREEVVAVDLEPPVAKAVTFDHDLCEKPTIEEEQGANNEKGGLKTDDATSSDETTTSSKLTAAQDFQAHHGVYYRQAYRMTPDHFWRLYNMLSPHLNQDDDNDAFRISVAVRYFAGGDSAVDHGITDEKTVDDCVWEIVKAIHKCKELDFEFPSHSRQREIAVCFELLKSDIKFSSCAGAVGSMLLWTDKPETEDSQDYYCAQKKRYGHNMQAICDHNNRFLEVNMDSPGATSDFVAFNKTEISKKIRSEGLLANGLALYGEESYSPCPHVVTPFQGEITTLKTDFNYFQKQLSSQIGSAFTQLLQRWAILRRPLPARYGPDRQRSLGLALCKLHNYCLEDTEPMLLGLARDLVYGLDHGAFLIVSNTKECELSSCGAHRDDWAEEHKADHKHSQKMRNLLLGSVEQRYREMNGAAAGGGETADVASSHKLHV